MKTAIIACAFTLLACSDDSGPKTCVGECSTVADCEQGTKHCEGGKCLQCKADADCPTLFKGGCDTSSGTCIPCKEDADCEMTYPSAISGSVTPLLRASSVARSRRSKLSGPSQYARRSCMSRQSAALLSPSSNSSSASPSA